MRRAIIDFVPDDKGDWVARLSCGHNQHVRHCPPYQERAWVLKDETRRARLGMPLSCPLCDRQELPEGLHPLRKSPAWDSESAPSAIRIFHRLAEGTWGVISVDDGHMRFVTDGEVVMNKVVDCSVSQAIPPELDHRLDFDGPIHFSIEYLKVERRQLIAAFDKLEIISSNEGGERACFAHIVCPVCGAVVENEPHLHRPGF